MTGAALQMKYRLRQLMRKHRIVLDVTTKPFFNRPKHP